MVFVPVFSVFFPEPASLDELDPNLRWDDAKKRGHVPITMGAPDGLDRLETKSTRQLRPRARGRPRLDGE